MLKKSLAVVTAAALTLGALAPAGAQPGLISLELPADRLLVVG